MLHASGRHAMGGGCEAQKKRTVDRTRFHNATQTSRASWRQRRKGTTCCNAAAACRAAPRKAAAPVPPTWATAAERVQDRGSGQRSSRHKRQPGLRGSAPMVEILTIGHESATCVATLLIGHHNDAAPVSYSEQQTAHKYRRKDFLSIYDWVLTITRRVAVLLMIHSMRMLRAPPLGLLVAPTWLRSAVLPHPCPAGVRLVGSFGDCALLLGLFFG